jgi:hypothetical protein
MSANDVLAALNVPRDFEYSKPETDADLMFVHRTLVDGDIYFVDNRRDREERIAATFRVEGKEPELWDAATGASAPASYQISGGRTTVSLDFQPYGSTFVIFREPVAALSRQVREAVETVIPGTEDELNRGWNIGFQPDRGAPANAFLTGWPPGARTATQASSTSPGLRLIPTPSTFPAAHWRPARTSGSTWAMFES